MSDQPVRLDKYVLGPDYNPGAALWKQLLWFYIGSGLLTSYWIPFSGFKVLVLRLFGASVGAGVRIKPGVRVKFPWCLTVGDNCWLGEDVWIDNLAAVAIAHDTCLSQGAYLCTGNHDWSSPTFDLRLGPITIGHSAWIGAKATIGPNVCVGDGAVLTLGSVANQGLDDWTIYTGNPAQPVRQRKLASS